MVLLLSATPGSPGEPVAPQAPAGPFAGSKSCLPCHQQFYQLWSSSFHGLAMQPFTPVLATGYLAPQTELLSVGTHSYRLAWDARQGWLEERTDGVRPHYPVTWVIGGKNVFYFLSPGERGRLQTLPVAYDVRSKTWFDTAAAGIRHFPGEEPVSTREPVDWTDRMYTFNTSCYGCHVSQLDSNYDPASDTYRTTWTEPGINCESCHGPGVEHNRLFRGLARGQVPADRKIIGWKGSRDAARLNDLCATCHAKLIPLTSTFRVGDRFFDHYDLALLDDPDFYPDGRDLGETYTFTGWLLSPCAEGNSLDCGACHTPSGRYRFKGKGNDVCLPCHARRVLEAAVHTRHREGSPGNECIGCHMPRTEFARMTRTDHSMLPPTPSATLRFSSPNACNAPGCHADRSASWADEQVRRWHGRDYQKFHLDRAELVAAARRRDWTRLPEMLAFLGSPDGNQVFRASLARLLLTCDDGRKWPALVKALGDPSPLVRARAAEGLAWRRNPEAAKALLEATRDEVRLVRLRAAEALAWYPREELTEEYRQSLETATGELLESYGSRPDDWSLQYNRGNFLAARGELDEAVKAYAAASRLEPRVVQPYVNAGLAQIEKGDGTAAETSLRQALARQPRSAEALFNLGLLLAEQGRRDEAEQSLKSALQADGTLAAAAYNLCVITSARLDEAVSWCRQAVDLAPGEPRYGFALAFSQKRAGDMAGAEKTLLDLVQRSHAYTDAYLLLGELYEGQGRKKAAAALYRGALEWKDLPEDGRQAIEARLRSVE